MNAIAAFYADTALRLANAQIHERHVEAARGRLAPRRTNRLAAAVTSVRRAFTAPAPADALTLPRLTDYPYRS